MTLKGSSRFGKIAEIIIMLITSPNVMKNNCFNLFNIVTILIEFNNKLHSCIDEVFDEKNMFLL